MGLFGKKKEAPAPPPRPAPRPAAPSLMEISFKMKMSAKQLGRQAQKSLKMQQVEEKKAKDALSKGNIAGARIHAESAIRNKNQAYSYMKLQSQLEAVASKVQAQQIRAQVANDMSQVTQSLDEAIGTMDVTKLAETMDQFVSQSEDMDLQTKFMDSAIGESTTATTPQSEVDSLLSRINDEHQLNQQHLIAGAPVPTGAAPSHAQQLGSDPSLEARLHALQGGSAGSGM